MERLKAKNPLDPDVFVHRWRENKLWLGLRYGDPMAPDAKTAAAAWNPRDGEWEMFPGPVDRVGGDFEIFNGALYWVSGWWEEKYQERASTDGTSPDSADRRHARPRRPGVYELAHELQKYDLKTRRWETLQFPGQKLAGLVAVNGRLFAVSDESILELLDGGKSTRILASCRRRPAVSALDSFDNLGAPTLFAGANDSLRAVVGQKIYSWDGHDWSTMLDLQFRAAADVRADGIVLRTDYHNHAHLWLLPRDQTNAQLCLDEATFAPAAAVFGQREVPAPKWKNTDDLSLTQGAVAVSGTNLYAFVAYNREARSSAEHWTLEKRNDRHASLAFLDQEFPKPFVVPVKFDLTQSPFTDSPRRSLPGMVQPWWIDLTSEYLLIGKRNAPGLWVIPRSEIDADLAQEMRPSREERARLGAAAARSRKAILEKYDLNRNGALDTEEREEAVGDPAFIELELAVMDANQNGRLEADELTCFDVNKNGVLEPKERAGIETAQRLLAARLVKDFDTNGDGRLDGTEFGAVVRNVQGKGGVPGVNLLYFDMNHDGKLDPDELSLFLMQETRRGLLDSPPMISSRSGPNGTMGYDGRLSFRSELEAYWKRHGASNDEPAPAGRSSNAATIRPGTNPTPVRH